MRPQADAVLSGVEPNGGTALGRQVAGTQLLSRALTLLLCLRDHDEPMTVSQIADALQLPSATVYRLIQTLELAGFVDRSSRPYVSLGLRFIDLGQAALQRIVGQVGPVVQPMLERLTADTGQTSLLVMPTGARATCVLSVESPRPIRLSYEPGRVLPLFAGASSKVLLPWLSTRIVDAVFAQAAGATLADGTRLSARRLQSDIEAIRGHGYCVSHGERDVDAGAVAAPVLLRGNQIFAGVSVAGPRATFDAPTVAQFVDRVRIAAGEIAVAVTTSRAAGAGRRGR